MRLHEAVLRPKFAVVLDTLERRLAGRGIASWHKPNGGYFVSVNVMDGCAKETVRLLKEAGVVMTGRRRDLSLRARPAGCEHPRCADLSAAWRTAMAMELFCVCASWPASKSCWRHNIRSRKTVSPGVLWAGMPFYFEKKCCFWDCHLLSLCPCAGFRRYAGVFLCGERLTAMEKSCLLLCANDKISPVNRWETLTFLLIANIIRNIDAGARRRLSRRRNPA